MPLRYEIKQVGCVTYDTVKTRAMLNRRVAPVIGPTPLHDRKLAVCGGGPLLVHDLDELRAWDGDVWGINHTAKWLCDRGVNATFVSVDPILVDVEPVENALICLSCHPHLFGRYKGKNVRAFETFEISQEVMIGGSSTATRMPSLGLRLGYQEISFFGCEGSYEGDQTHVDREADEPFVFIIRAGDKDYKVEIALMQQCKELVAYFAEFPHLYKNRSGGLLKAMIENPDTWEVVGVSSALREVLIGENDQAATYDTPYKPLMPA